MSHVVKKLRRELVCYFWAKSVAQSYFVYILRFCDRGSKNVFLIIAALYFLRAQILAHGLGDQQVHQEVAQAQRDQQQRVGGLHLQGARQRRARKSHPCICPFHLLHVSQSGPVGLWDLFSAICVVRLVEVCQSSL